MRSRIPGTRFILYAELGFLGECRGESPEQAEYLVRGRVGCGERYKTGLHPKDTR